MYFTYIIRSIKTNKHYIGSCENVSNRIDKHNQGYNKSTRNKGPWILVYKESFNTRQEAYKREKKIKAYKGGRAFKNLIINSLGCRSGQTDQTVNLTLERAT